MKRLKKTLIAFVSIYFIFQLFTGQFLCAAELNLALWCEYPAYGSGCDMKGYFSRLLDFIREKNIRKLLFRVMDPPHFPIFMLGESKAPDNGLFISFISSPDFIASGCEVYIIPWLNQEDDWGYPLNPTASKLPSSVTKAEWNKLNHIKRSVLYAQLANEYISKVVKSGSRITGVVYEEEGAGIWGGKEGTKKAFIEFNSALKSYIKAPSPSYGNGAESQFKFASASQYNFNDHETGVYLNEIYPQMYNLTAGSDPMSVDAVAVKSIIRGNNYKPRFPVTIYTQYCNNPQKLAETFTEFIKPYPDTQRRNDIYYMFSAERAPRELYGLKNTFNKSGTTITGIDMTGGRYKGKINAFGSPQYSWDTFILFLEAFGKEYQTDNFAIFQFNLIPDSWADSAREQTSDSL